MSGHLAFAHSIGRVLVTANRRDFDRIHREWMASGNPHSGIVLVEQRTSIGDQIRGLARIHSERQPHQLLNQLLWLENWL
jgi:hypothetical protein